MSATQVDRSWHCVAGVVVVVIGALGASWIVMSLAVSAAGGPPEHDAGESFANLAGLVVTGAATLGLGLSAFAAAWHFRRAQRRALFSTIVGLIPGAVAIAAVPLLWPA